MKDVNLLAVFVATIAGFLLSGAWYAVQGETMVRLQSKEPDPNDPSEPPSVQPWEDWRSGFSEAWWLLLCLRRFLYI